MQPQLQQEIQPTHHMTSVHGIENVVSTTAKRFTCHIESCEESFYHASQLTQHYKMKHNTNISK